VSGEAFGVWLNLTKNEIVAAGYDVTTDENHMNVYVYAHAHATLPGDIDLDGDVDRYDFGIFAGAYGSGVGDPNYNDQCDFDSNGHIDSYELAILVANYGKKA
jgi:hypothetical protein